MGIKSLNKIKIYSDNAKMYQSFDFIQTGKNKFTNKIESFNFQIRNKVSFLLREAQISNFCKKDHEFELQTHDLFE
jgi:hypothetical protein